MAPRWACAAVLAALSAAAAAAPAGAARADQGVATPEHSCYYFVVFELGCRPGHTPSAVSACLACAEAHNATLRKEGCTDALINSACHGVLPPTPPTPPAAGAMALTLLTDAAREQGAVCLDGSPAGYYFRAGVGEGASKWLLVFNGGGWCMGTDADSIVRSCAARATGALGSSKGWKQSLAPDAHGVTSPNCTVNPAFCNWNVAYMYYCDGQSFSGDLADPVPAPNATVGRLFFRGRRVMDANIRHLLASRGLANATDVVLGGHSAGGLATYLHADAVRAMLPPAAAATFRAVPDAGFFLDHADVFGERSYGAQMRATFAFANTSAVLNRACVAERSDAFDCVFPQNFAQHVATPLHVVQSEYDQWQLSNVLRLPCDPPKAGDCNASMMLAFQRFGADAKAAANASGLYSGSPSRAIWSDACIAHTQGYYGDYYDNQKWEVPAGSGVTLASALDAWVTERATGPSAVHVDTAPWPGNQPCSTSGVRAAADAAAAAAALR